jgi:hypothetical protein
MTMATATATPETPPATPARDDDDELVVGIGPEVDVADGTYPATLTKLEPFTAEREGEPVDLIRWTFAIEDANVGPVEVAGVSSRARGPRAKSVAWLAALVPGAKPGTNFRARELIGRECLVVIEHDDNGFPRVGNVVATPTRKAR